MSTPISFSATLPDGTKHVVSLTQTGTDTATIKDDAWAPGATAPHEQSYNITNVRRDGDVVTATLRVFIFPAKITFTLFTDHVQLVAPGHDMAYPVTTGEYVEAQAFIAEFPSN